MGFVTKVTFTVKPLENTDKAKASSVSITGFVHPLASLGVDDDDEEEEEEDGEEDDEDEEDDDEEEEEDDDEEEEDGEPVTLTDADKANMKKSIQGFLAKAFAQHAAEGEDEDDDDDYEPVESDSEADAALDGTCAFQNRLNHKRRHYSFLRRS
jgi:ABC-type Zn2+ transport system substrate-binding protein/surface adhesin